jgi:hypothetical protein
MSAGWSTQISAAQRVFTLIYALKGDPEGFDILSSLRQGEGRFGWSYCSTADLRELRSKIEAAGWESGLSDEEKDCYQSFLLDLQDGDYVVYINVPEWGHCTIARVTGPYVWRFEDKDFNHRFPVDPSSVLAFDRNDAVVHPALSARLKLRGRYWRIYLQDEFAELIKALTEGIVASPRTPVVNLAFLAKEIQPFLVNITERIHHTHPNTALEALLAEVFKNVPGVREVKWQGGAGDYGADLIVVFESGLPVPGLQRQSTCVIQAKSFEGEHWDITAANDIRRAFDHYPEADMGLIVSTATAGSKVLENALDQIREHTGKPVALLIGADVAAFLLRFGGQSLG